MITGPSEPRVVHLILAAGHSLLVQLGSPTKPVRLYATFNSWLAIGRSKQRSGTSRAIPMLSASS